MAWCRYRVLHHPSGGRQQHADATVRIDRMARRYVLFLAERAVVSAPPRVRRFPGLR